MMPVRAGTSTILDIVPVLQTPSPAARTGTSVLQTPPPARDADYLPALTGLRFFLALWVILHHITGKGMLLEAWSHGLPHPLLALIRGGYLAVQTFFVLSGFVLSRTYAHVTWNRRSLARFATARFARIYPVYFLSLIIVSPFIIEMLVAPTWSAMQRIKILGIYVFVLQGWVGSLDVGWNTPAWTLTCEFTFYLCFPLLFLLLRRAGWLKVVLALAVAVVLPIALDHSGIPWIWKPIYDMADFIAGVVAGRIFVLLTERSGAWRGRGYWLYLPALLLGGWLIIHPSAVEGTGAAINEHLRSLNVALIVGLALSGGWLARLLSTPAGDFLGKASYSMYVLHVPILWWTGRYFLHGKLHPPLLLGAAIYLSLVIGASALVFSRFEAPMSTRIRQWQKARERRP